MRYNEILNTLSTVALSYKGKISFGSGTIEQLNADDDRIYPCIWVSGIAVQSAIAANSIKSQGIRVSVRFLQTGSIEQSESTDQQLFNETFDIANGFIQKLYSTFDDDNDTLNTIQVGELTQIFRQQDSVHLGWVVPITISSYVNNECCELFE